VRELGHAEADRILAEDRQDHLLPLAGWRDRGAIWTGALATMQTQVLSAVCRFLSHCHRFALNRHGSFG